MKRTLILCVAGALLLGSMAAWVHADPASTAFTYQAQFKKDGALFTGTIDFSANLFDAQTGGTLVAGPVNVPGVSVVDGVFTVPLDFGSDPFNGDARFLEIAVREAGEPAFTTLSPRQALTPTPYAIRALVDQVVGLVLPFEATIDDPADAFSITNDGGRALVGSSPGSTAVRGGTTTGFGVFGQSGGAGAGVAGTSALGFSGFFENTNILNPSPALQVTTNSTGAPFAHAISGSTINNAVGSAGAFTNFNPASTAPTLRVDNQGDGPAIQAAAFAFGEAGFFAVTGDTLSVAPALRAVNAELGSAGEFLIQKVNGNANPGNGVPALKAIHKGFGPAGYFEVTGASGINPQPAVQVKQAGFGEAAKIALAVSDPATNAKDALLVTTNGIGRAGLFEITNNNPTGATASQATALEARTNGMGRAAFFEVLVLDPVVNNNPALEVQTNGTGPAARIVANKLSSTAPGFVLENNGDSPAATLDQLNQNTSTDALVVRADSLGSAARFEVVNASNDAPGVFTRHAGGGAALSAKSDGNGFAGLFDVSDPNGDPTSNISPAVLGTTLGMGEAAFFNVFNPDNEAAALKTLTKGLGSAARLEIDRPFTGTGTDPVNNSPALHVTTNASGQVARLESTSVESVNPALEATVAGRGIVGRFAANAADNPNTAVVAQTSGLGSAGSFEIFNANNTSSALFVATNGTGPAATFEGLNAPNASVDTVQIRADNARHALFAQQTGVGEVANFEVADPGNANLGVFIKNNGTGIALRVENQNPNFAALAMGVLGKSAFNGQVDILGPTGGPVPVNITGNVGVTGNLTVSGGQICGPVCGPIKEFKIDHPLDPDNKYLKHASIESDEMLNLYSGNVRTDGRGYATVELPSWFEALNTDFRYQLTVIDEADTDTFVLAKVVRPIKDNRFAIRTSAPRIKVSWQVTGVRQDAYARTHPLEVEMDKPQAERGRYLAPEAFGRPEEYRVGHVAPLVHAEAH